MVYMQITSPLQLVSGCQTRSLATLIDLYERNYRRLACLAPGLDRIGDHRVSRIPGVLDLHLGVLERHKYTVEILITYRFQDREAVILEPDMLVRVYHDARVAEAKSRDRGAWRLRSPCQRRAVPTELEWKWALNAFLHRWLGYCLRQGHLFDEPPATPLKPLIA